MTNIQKLYFCCQQNVSNMTTLTLVYLYSKKRDALILLPRIVGKWLFLLMLFIHPHTGAATEERASLLSLTNQQKNEIDSFLYVIEHTNGQKCLDTYTDLVDFLYGSVDQETELYYLHLYLSEAQKQQNTYEESFVRVRILNTYYNYDMTDSLFSALPPYMEFIEKANEWGHFYAAWEMKVSYLVHLSRLESALREAQQMYDHALQNDETEGIGLSAFCLGKVYRASNRYDEAENFLLEAVLFLEENHNLNYTNEAFFVLSEIYADLERYEDILQLEGRWTKILDTYEARMTERGMSPNMDIYRFYCAISMTGAYIGLKNETKALAYLEKTKSFFNEEHMPAAKNSYHIALAGYYELTEEYDKAIAYLDTAYHYEKSIDHNNASTTLKNKARLLHLNGQSREAALIYEQIIFERDSIHTTDLTNQLHDMSVRYEVDKLNMQKEKISIYMWIAIGLCVLLLIGLIGFGYYTLSLSQKSKHLHRHLEDQEDIKKNLFRLQNDFREATESGTFETNKEEILFKRLNDYLTTSMCYTQSDLDVNELAKALNSNTTYVYSCIKEMTGLKPLSYIHKFRLSKACELLLSSPSKSIDDIAIECGFNTARNFYRIFRQHYQMSPSEFRKEQREIMKNKQKEEKKNKKKRGTD